MAVTLRERRGGGGSAGRIWDAVRPPPGTLVLVGVTLLLSAIAVWANVRHALVIEGPPETLRDLVPRFFTNTFVNLGSSPVSLIVYMALLGFIFQDVVRGWWYRRRVQLIAGVIGFFLAFWLLNRFVLEGAWGLAAAVLALSWLGAAVERRWGAQRLLIFSAAVAVSTNLVALGLLWLWPGAIQALIGGDLAPPVGSGALTTALLTAFAMMMGPARLALLRIEASKLVWVLVVFGVLEALLISVAVGVYTLSGIAAARLLIRGTWRPDRWYNELRLWMLRRRNAKRRAEFKVINGGGDRPTYHRIPWAPR